jgi:hypothetical protein
MSLKYIYGLACVKTNYVFYILYSEPNRAHPKMLYIPCSYGYVWLKQLHVFYSGSILFEPRPGY